MFIAYIEFVAAYSGLLRMLCGELQRAEDTEPKRMAWTLLWKYGERQAVLLENGNAEGDVDFFADTAFIGAI